MKLSKKLISTHNIIMHYFIQSEKPNAVNASTCLPTFLLLFLLYCKNYWLSDEQNASSPTPMRLFSAGYCAIVMDKECNSGQWMWADMSSTSPAMPFAYMHFECPLFLFPAMRGGSFPLGTEMKSTCRIWQSHGTSTGLFTSGLLHEIKNMNLSCLNYFIYISQCYKSFL